MFSLLPTRCILPVRSGKSHNSSFCIALATASLFTENKYKPWFSPSFRISHTFTGVHLSLNHGPGSPLLFSTCSLYRPYLKPLTWISTLYRSYPSLFTWTFQGTGQAVLLRLSCRTSPTCCNSAGIQEEQGMPSEEGHAECPCPVSAGMGGFSHLRVCFGRFCMNMESKNPKTVDKPSWVPSAQWVRWLGSTRARDAAGWAERGVRCGGGQRGNGFTGGDGWPGGGWAALIAEAAGTAGVEDSSSSAQRDWLCPTRLPYSSKKHPPQIKPQNHFI